MGCLIFNFVGLRKSRQGASREVVPGVGYAQQRPSPAKTGSTFFGWMFKFSLLFHNILIRERFGHYLLVQVPSLPALKILIGTNFSAVQTLVELTAVEIRALLGSQQVLRDIPRIMTIQD